jgi:hypothetical protein
MIPETFRNHDGATWDGTERRRATSMEHHPEQGQIHQAITEIKVMAERFSTLDKTLAAFISEMKEFQTTSAHQARQDYEYLDTKIDRRAAEAEAIARDAQKKVDEHIIISKRDERNRGNAGEWVRWILPVTVTVVIAAITFFR